MYRVTVSTTFTATHAVTVQGVDETPHHHEWKAEVVLEGASLDEDGLLIDFLEVERNLKSVIEPLDGSNLNEIDTLGGANPSAEHVALYVGREMKKLVQKPARIQSVTITEAPNCQATYEL